uniref:Uncharacterized protein n=1 Tax=Siphoviridae sp. ctBLh2 TaxID=2827803 RepID=A0A8S5S3Z2_9CAUD|nr:MAG TPA: hypothetical protein [Siphoviridae sp. ctBLh2]
MSVTYLNLSDSFVFTRVLRIFVHPPLRKGRGGKTPRKE